MKAAVHRLGRATLLFIVTALLAQSTPSAAQSASRPAPQLESVQATARPGPTLPDPATNGSGCYVYPLTFHQSYLDNVPGPGGHPAPVPLPEPNLDWQQIEAMYPSSIITVTRDPDIGNFLSLRWNSNSSGDSAASLLNDFSGAGTLGYNFVESRDLKNYVLEPGDWVYGTAGNTSVLGSELTRLRDTKTMMLLPLHDQRSGAGSNMEFHLTKVTAVRLVSWNFAAGTNKYIKLALARDNATYSCFKNFQRRTVGQITQFTPTMALTTGLSLNWNFGDGTSGINPTHIYQASGTYTVTLTTTDSSGFVTRALGSIMIDPAPTVTWTSSSPDDLGQPTSFTSTIIGTDPFGLTWIFGDGTALSGVANPSHTYDAPGNYTATLRVIDRNGFAVMRSGNVTIYRNDESQAGCYVYPLTFHDSQLENVPGPDGHPAPTPLPNPNLDWQQIEAMHPSSIINVTRDPDTGTFLFLDWLNYDASAPENVWNPFSGAGNLGSEFTESRAPRNNVLEPGDWVGVTTGNFATLGPELTRLRDTNTMMLLPLYDTRTGNGLNMEFHITKVVAVRLVGWNFVGTNKYIKLALARNNATYSCFRSSAPDRIGQTTQFTATMALTSGLSLNWDFGDGTSGSGINPTHIYPASGTYTVTLTTTDSSGFVTRARGPVVIINAPAATWTSGPHLAGQPTQFTSSATGAGSLSYDWDFGDGSPHATTANPSHTYTAAGSYLVRLVVTDANGVSASSERSITIEPRIENHTVYLPQLWSNATSR